MSRAFVWLVRGAARTPVLGRSGCYSVAVGAEGVGSSNFQTRSLSLWPCSSSGNSAKHGLPSSAKASNSAVATDATAPVESVNFSSPQVPAILSNDSDPATMHAVQPQENVEAITSSAVHGDSTAFPADSIVPSANFSSPQVSAILSSDSDPAPMHTAQSQENAEAIISSAVHVDSNAFSADSIPASAPQVPMILSSDADPAPMHTAQSHDNVEAIISSAIHVDSNAFSADSIPASAGPMGSDGVEAAAGLVAETTSSWSDLFVQPTIAFLTNAHEFTGLPWWATIVVGTIAIRTILLPASLYTMRNAARMSAVQEDLKGKRDEIMAAVQSGNTHLGAEKQREQKEFLKAAGISPLKVLIGPLVQFPVFISFFVGVRRLAQSNPELATGGTGWFLDLGASDPTFALPIMAGLTLGAMTELGGDTGTKMTAQMKMIMRTFCVASVPMTAWFPAGVFCYWIPNNLFSVILSSTTRMPAVRSALGLKVDLKTIPGSRAATQARRTGQFRQESASPDMAAISYVRKGANIREKFKAQDDPKVVSSVGEPILFKSRREAKRAVASSKV